MALYHCKGCDQTVERDSDRKTFMSFCETAQKDILLTRVRLAEPASHNSKKASPLPKETVEKIIKEMKAYHDRRYGIKMKDYKYIPARNTYKTEHLYDDLEFVLNHIHL